MYDLLTLWRVPNWASDVYAGPSEELLSLTYLVPLAGVTILLRASTGLHAGSKRTTSKMWSTIWLSLSAYPRQKVLKPRAARFSVFALLLTWSCRLLLIGDR